jgi:hypothetical protein
MSYPYDPSRRALLSPTLGASFFPGGRPAAEPVLCAELSRLAYAPFEREPSAKAFVEETLRRIGFGACSFFNTATTHAFLARDPATPLSVLAFRGTGVNIRDVTTDLHALLVPWSAGGQVHQGFAEALTGAWEAVAAALAPVTGRRLFTGHSLGAALATLAASRHSPQALYTYGSPRVGDLAFAEAVTSVDHHRYVNCCDIVCRVPPEDLSYRHSGSATYLDRQGAQHEAPSEPLITADQRHARRAYVSRLSWRPGTHWTRDASDHAPINYVSALSHSHEHQVPRSIDS